jgi:hypothetical protein
MIERWFVILPVVWKPRNRLAYITILIAALPLIAQSPSGTVGFMPYSDAKPILEALEEALPPELRDIPAKKREAAWIDWAKSRDTQIRARLARGDEDTVVNFLLFGTSFTHQPRLRPELLRRLRDMEQEVSSKQTELSIPQLLRVRTQDLLISIKSRRGNERLAFARRVLARRGFGIRTPAERVRAAQFLEGRLMTMLKEEITYAEMIQSARQLGNATEELAERSTLFRDRGLSLDTSWRPDFAIEESLRVLKDRGLILPGSVHRVAVIGPGLDFTDKQEGYDFYPLQTIQPFAIIDSLLRAGLARPDKLEVTTLDISSRVNEHIARMRGAAVRGRGYTIQLPLDQQTPWKSDALRYWRRFGDQISAQVPPLAVPREITGLEVRALHIPPEVVRRVHPVDLDIVLQRVDCLNFSKRFDLVIATNILVYYGVFEQTLALSNIQAMLQPGGFLLSNNALLELPFSRIRSIGYRTTVYSEHLDDGDHIVWYQRRLEP